MFDEEVSPIGSVLGPGEPEQAVVGSVHGDEPTGVRAIQRLLDPEPTFEAAVSFLVANPPAAVAHRRYLDADLNRVFPGDPDADARERRLAAALRERTRGMDVLSIHTTHATPEPVAFVTAGHPRALELVSNLPVEYVVNEAPVVEHAFSSVGSVVSVEAGKPEHHDAVGKAERTIQAFLGATGGLDDSPAAETDQCYFTIDGTVEKPAEDDSYELLAENFERVEAGTPYARSSDGPLVAEEPFVPVLMSEAGYPEIFGYRGYEVASSVEGAREAWLGGA